MDNERGHVAAPAGIAEPIPIEIRVPPGYWRKDDTHMLRPITPMTESVTHIGDAFGQACADFGLLLQPKVTSIGGWHYVSMQPVGGKPDAPAPPGWLLPLLLRLSPDARARMRRSKEVTKTDFVNQVIDRWNTELLPEFEQRIAALREADLSAMDDDELGAHLTAARELCANGLRIHFQVNIANWLAMAELSFTCRDLLGWQQSQVDELVAGLSSRSTEPARKLAMLAGVSEDGPEFEAYLQVYGCRSLTLEVADPTIKELPGLMWGLLRDQIAKGYDPVADARVLAHKRSQAAADARDSLRGAELERFERSLARAIKAYPVREDNVFFTSDAPNALLRYAALETGHRLAERGQLRTRDDVFFLKVDEALEGLRHGSNQMALVERRKGEHAWALANPGPATYGKNPGPPPSARWLRADLRMSMEAMMWFAKHVMAPELSHRDADTKALVGIAGASGRYCGSVKVIGSEAEFGKLRAGDVLVCASARPSWSVLFPSAGAIVTDAGGTLSHPAIIAREHRIPTVVATGHATTSLQDGQIVTVDGTRGIVEV
jgi:pyruvate,water dikinase